MLKNKKFKRLVVGSTTKSGRNVYGKIVNLDSGGGNKKSKILIDYSRRWTKKIACCIHVTKDSNRTCFVALLKYSNGTFSYVLASSKTRAGNYYYSTIVPPRFSLIYKSGCNVMLRYINYNTLFFNLEVSYKDGGKYCRSAGTFCKAISLNFDKDIAKVILPTGCIKVVSIYNIVTLGQASNTGKRFHIYSKAGYYRRLNYRPTVRGVAMNPVDNPHGGRTKTNSPELTPWGKIAKYNR